MCNCLKWWGVQWACPSDLSVLASWWFGYKFKDVKCIWESLFSVILWSILLARNELVFKGKMLHLEEVVELVKVRTTSWVIMAKNIKDDSVQVRMG